MSGLTNLLNIAKVGLLAHQTNLQTIGHNISNVNTSGYSKQSVVLAAKDPTPTFIGHIGNGVEATEITRAYDRFITSALFSKESELSGLETRLSGLKTIESLFNEVEDNALNNLLEEFWQGWDDLANNAEGMAERTTLLQRATLIAQSLNDKYQNLMKLSKDIDLNIQTSIENINRITRQIAELNVQIVAAESGHHEANDLRDQRDELVKRLSELANVRYFETERGSYTILIGQGSPLVEDNKSWELGLLNGKVTWFGSNGQNFELTTRDISSGELGGWLDIKERLKPKDPTELTNSVVNTANGGEAIHLDTLFSDIDGVIVNGSFTIEFSGIDQEGNPISDTFSGDETSTLRDFAEKIEDAFGANKIRISTTDDGRIKIEDIDPDTYPISFQIDDISGSIIGLNLGKFDNNYPLSYTEELNLIAKQLIKTINKQHAQGVGLIPLQESTSTNKIINPDEALMSKSSGLEFSSDIKEGSFEIWLFDTNGEVIDQTSSTSEVNEPVKIDIDDSTTLNDLANQIDAIDGLSAKVVNDQTLVIGLDGTNDVGGFAFGNDTSNVLMALGLNSFFIGTGANDIKINKALLNDPRLIAAAQVESSKVNSASSINPVIDINRNFGVQIENGQINVQLTDENGNIVADKNINIDNTTTSLNDILNQIDEIEGLKAYVEAGKVRIETENPGYQFTISDDSSGQDTNFFEYLGQNTNSITGTQFESNWLVDRTFDPVNSYNTGVTNGSIKISVFDENGEELDTDSGTAGIQPVEIQIDPSSDSLESIKNYINQNYSNYLRATITDGRLELFAAGQAYTFTITDDTSNLTDFIMLKTPEGGSLNPANNENAIAIRNLNHIPIEELNDATINDAYHSLVGEIGIYTRTVELDHDFTMGAVKDLFDRRENISGVSLDEELSDLLKFQHAYAAATKLIKAADEMFLSLLQTK